MDLTQFIQLLRARQRLLWTVFGIVVVLSLLPSLIQPKTYLGEVSVIVDSKATDPITGLVRPAQMQPGNLATQIDVITSHNVAAKVVAKLHLADVAELKEQFRDETRGTGLMRDWLADKLLQRLEVKPSRESSMINIRFAGSDPVFAASLANAFADAYIQTSLELTADPARRQASWFDEQIRGLRTAVEIAQRHLSEYQRKEDIVGTDDRLDVENAKLVELTSQLVGAQTAMYDAQNRLKQMNQALARNQLQELPDILGNPLLQSMKVDLVRAQGTLAQVEQRFDRNHPQYISASAQVKALQSKLAAEIATAKGSIGQAAEIAERRAQQLQRAAEEQKNRILELKRRRDTLDVLRHEVETAQHAYDAAAQRASEVRLQAHLDQSNVAVLNPAIPPLHAARPKPLLNLLVGLILGATLGAGVVLAAELMNRRVRTREDVAKSAGVVVLAELPRAANRTRRRRFRARPPGAGRAAGIKELGPDGRAS